MTLSCALMSNFVTILLLVTQFTTVTMWAVLDSNHPSAGGLPCQDNALAYIVFFTNSQMNNLPLAVFNDFSRFIASDLEENSSK